LPNRSERQKRIERVEQALEQMRAGRMVILVDDEDRENEGDLTMAAEKVTPEAINFMARYCRGLICLTLTEERADHLQLPLQAARSGGPPLGTAFTVTIEARRGVTTGISAADRAHTILTAVAPDARADDLITPGHIFPLRAKRGGTLVRTGQTEGSVDLARLCGLAPAGVICEIMNDDGTMARLPDLQRFAKEHGLLILSVADIIEYRLQTECLVERCEEFPIVPSIDGVPLREFRGARLRQRRAAARRPARHRRRRQRRAAVHLPHRSLLAASGPANLPFAPRPAAAQRQQAARLRPWRPGAARAWRVAHAAAHQQPQEDRRPGRPRPDRRREHPARTGARADHEKALGARGDSATFSLTPTLCKVS
jgi:3,4-dihydroxy-2-butanone 4-phosphate synthase